ncbi:MAG: fatty acid desaturase [Methylicorpusculum sp.]|uniref:fatty acid desaturase n=1 Tax=Methylicorpusculum sp. TaxID=2713644 RepID=UPI002726E3D9|nr:fatty acid desaturase [Methylicorpusculum sp.]MDO8939583.1 fatty acid desaturase [Methylicorpusculum sp.]MDP2201356.1 fatty acid desaturase [Methylicorpusculum sp.]
MNSRLSSLLSLIFPITSLLFLNSGSHSASEALLWTTPFWLVLAADWLSPSMKHLSVNNSPEGFFNGLLYGLAFLQFINLAMMIRFIGELTWLTTQDIMTSVINLLVVRFLVGTSSCCSGIIVAHELIHRGRPLQRWLGRLLLMSVCYDHFAVAHKRGHHSHIGTPHDITTAQRDESFKAYWRRVAKEHFLYAWRCEKRRLDKKSRGFLLNTVSNKVLQGLLVELAVVGFIYAEFGLLCAVMFLYQAYSAVRMLEAVNYFQHWGLIEEETHHAIAWVSDSWFSNLLLLGLPCHICHHQNATVQFQDLVYYEQGPKMPYGYFVTNLWVRLSNTSFRQNAALQLESYTRRGD